MDETAVSTLFWHYLDDEPHSVQAKLLDPKTGPYLFFRRSKTPIQARLAHLFASENTPRVFLHGSPHIDNYAKMKIGYGMIDFDRAYLGPYIWDVVCCLLAINLRNPETHFAPLSPSVCQTFYDHYLHHFKHPELAYIAYAPLEKIKPKKWETDIDLYLDDQHKWAKKLEKMAVSLDDPIAQAVFHDYKKYLPDTKALAEHQLTHIARAAGSFGRRRYLYVLNDPKQKQAPIMLDIKETRNYLDADWPHNIWYQTPCRHQGQRMVHAAQLHAPTCALLESYATVNGIQYWGRQVPLLNRKPAKVFSEAEQIAFAISAGSQLGRGHRLGLQATEPDTLLEHFSQHFNTLIDIIGKIQTELLSTWQACIKGE